MSNCDSMETSEPAGLADAEEQIDLSCTEKGWEVQGETAVCPECIDKADR